MTDPAPRPHGPTRLSPLRSRQLGLGALCIGTAVALFPWLGAYLLERSASLGLNLALEGGVMLLVFSGAYLLSLALLGFAAPERYGGRRLFEIAAPQDRGSDASDEGNDDDPLDGLRPPARYPMLPFAAVLVAIIFGVSLLGNEVAGDLFSRQREVRYNTILRSADVDARRKIIRELAQSEFKAVIEAYTPILWRQSTDADEEVVRAEAAWALAEIATRMHKSVLILHSQAELQGWERAWLDEAKAAYGHGAVSAFRSEGAALQRPLFRLVLHIDADRAVELAEIYLNHPRPDAELLIDIAYLLSQSSSLQACGILFQLTGRDDPRLRAVATLSAARLLRMFKAEKDGAEIPESKRFNKRLSKELKSRELPRLCAAVESLQHLKDARYTGTLIKLFNDETVAGERCEEVSAADHLGRADILLAREELYYKVLRAIAGIAVGNDKVKRFLKNTLEQKELPENLRREVEHVQKLLHKAEADAP